MKQQRRYKEPQDTLWGKFLSGFMAVVFAMSTLTLIPIASAINGEPNEAQIQQQEELADQTSGKDEKAVEPAADEQKLEPVELLSIASVEDEDDADDAAPADVTLKVKAQNATVTYNGNDVATELVVPADKDVKFTIKAANGFTLGAAAVKLTDAKGETTLTPNAGEYTVAADRVADGATVVVTAEAVAGSANTDAAEPSTPAPSTELGEKMEMAKSVVTTIIDSVFGGTSTLTITGEDKVAVGKTISLTSNKGSWSHSWKSSDPQTATVSGDSRKATVTGVSAGTATITHTYSGGTDTYTVTVFEATYPVYVYAQIHFSDGVSESERIAFNTDNGYKANGNTKDTWYTLGNIQSVSNIPDPQGLALKTAYSNSGALGSLSSINPWNGNKELIKHIANWDDLKVSDGADDYVSDTGTHTWHLDGYASVIKYTWVDRNETVDTKVDFSGSYTKENDGPKDSLKENPGYTFGGWTESKSGDDVVFTANWIPNTDITYVVNYVDAEGNVLHEAKTVTGQTMDSTVEEAAEAIAGYTADAQTKTLRLAAENNVITFVYTKGLFPYTVNYVDEDGNTLLDPKTGAPQEFESVISSSNEVVSIPGYVFESADKEQLNIGAVEADNVITLTYAVDVITDPNNDNNGDENPGDGIPDKYQAVVNYESANDAQGTVNLEQKVVTFANNATSGSVNIFDGVATNPTAGFVFDGWTEGGNAVASNLTRVLQGNTVYTFTANWALDVIGTDPTDPGNNVPDGIADKYQLVVTYAAIAGTIDGPARYVLNKYDAAGNLAEDGVAILTAAQIPGATADDGYGNGIWNNEPLANMELTDDTAFVIAFTALPAAAVVVPPLAPVAAAAPAAAAAAAATILDDGVPLATIVDDENALAAFEEVHCWTHWLMIFGALVTIVYGLAVLYRRRHGIRDMDDFEGDIMGGRKYDAATEKNPATGNAFQAM